MIAAYNSFSPGFAQGAGLSSIVKINGIARKVPSNSQCVVTIVGQAGAQITNGIIGDNLNLGTQWALPALVTIPPVVRSMSPRHAPQRARRQRRPEH